MSSIYLHTIFSRNPRILLPYAVAFIFALIAVGFAFRLRSQELASQKAIGQLEVEKSQLQGKVDEIALEIDELEHQDQKVRNDTLEDEIQRIHTTYLQTAKVYEELLKVKELTPKTAALDALYAKAIVYLADRNWASASATLLELSAGTRKLQESIAASYVIPTSVPVNNSPPTGGYSRQTVQSDIGNFLVDIVSADLSATRVIVDSASDQDCPNDCPVLSLADYVSRNAGYAGINGSYFCPATYPSCQDKKNSFDTLLMNRNKKYINSDNNVYSTVPAVIFLGSSVRFVGRSLEWGRDTGVDGVLANQPLLLSGGNTVFNGDGDPKKGTKGSRSFVGNRGNTVYIGVTYNATVAEVAHVLKALGLENALNLDSGGSTALWYGGYKVGPGRNIPNSIVFVKR